MVAINQRIPNFIGGVSQQPDKVKYPGQVRVCDNALPDMTHGLIKRPPAEFVAKLDGVYTGTDENYWYEVFRDVDEKFLVQIIIDDDPAQHNTAPIRVWNMKPIVVRTADNFYNQVPTTFPSGAAFANGATIPPGTRFTVNEQSTNAYDYLKNSAKPGVLSIQDYTIISNPNKLLEESSTTSDAPISSRGKYAFASLDTLAYNNEYVLYTGDTEPEPHNYYRVTGVSVSHYDSDSNNDSDQNWIQGGGDSSDPNSSKLEGTSFTKNHGEIGGANTEHGSRNGVIVWSMNGGGESVFSSSRCNCDIEHLPSTHGSAVTIGGKKRPTLKIDSIGSDALGQTYNWRKGDRIFVNFDSRKDGSNPSGGGLPNITEDQSFYIASESGGDIFIGLPEANEPSGGTTDTGGLGTIRHFVEDIEGVLTVNSINFQDTKEGIFHDATGNNDYDDEGQSDEFLGWGYDTKYTAEVSITSAGLICARHASDAKKMFVDVQIEGETYCVRVDAVEAVDTFEGVNHYSTIGMGFAKTPRTPDQGSLSATKVLKALKDSGEYSIPNIPATGGTPASADIEVIGKGLYIKLNESNKYNVSFTGGTTGMTVIGRSARNVSKLPDQCKHGYIVQISNDENNESDNYYLKFLADNGVGGSGRWEECLRPNNFSDDATDSEFTIKLGWNRATLPHALINRRTGIFDFRELTEHSTENPENFWEDRKCGDNETNPYPSIKGLGIQQMFFFRNRLGLIADEQVLMSRPSDYFNLFNVSALTISDDNPIDVTVNDTKPAYIKHTLPHQAGVLLFSDTGQFLLYADSDVFSTKTSRIKKLSSYETDTTVPPVDLGVSYMFTSNVSAFSRAFEARIVDSLSPPSVLEQTIVVPEYLPKAVDRLKCSPTLGIATFAESGTDVLYHYKYYDAGEERLQTAWYSWTIKGNLKHCFYNESDFYTVTQQTNSTDYILCRHEYTTNIDASSYPVGGAAADVGSRLKTARGFEGHLDMMVVPESSDISYSAQGPTIVGPDFTEITLPFTPTDAANFYAVALSGTDSNGNNVAGTVVKATSTTTNKATFNNVNMTGWTVAVGYKYTTTIELPTYYPGTGQATGQYDINSTLKIAGINFELGISGPMEFHLTSPYSYTDASGAVTKDVDDYIQHESGTVVNVSTTGSIPSELSKSVRVPVYRKNDKYNLTIKFPDPFYTSLLSASWDGVYNQRRHARK